MQVDFSKEHGGSPPPPLPSQKLPTLSELFASAASSCDCSPSDATWRAAVVFGNVADPARVDHLPSHAAVSASSAAEESYRSRPKPLTSIVRGARPAEDSDLASPKVKRRRLVDAAESRANAPIATRSIDSPMAHAMGLSWSEEDDLLLWRLQRIRMSYKRMQTHFPGRTKAAIFQRLYKLKKSVQWRRWKQATAVYNVRWTEGGNHWFFIELFSMIPEKMRNRVIDRWLSAWLSHTGSRRRPSWALTSPKYLSHRLDIISTYFKNAPDPTFFERVSQELLGESPLYKKFLNDIFQLATYQREHPEQDIFITIPANYVDSLEGNMGLSDVQPPQSSPKRHSIIKATQTSLHQPARTKLAIKDLIN